MHKASGLSWWISLFIPRIKFMFFIGIDVLKAKLDCSLLLEVASGKRRAKTVANSQAGASELLTWCVKHHAFPQELHAIREGTGVYHEQAALALADAGVTVSIVNPAPD
jgi:transposase